MRRARLEPLLRAARARGCARSCPSSRSARAATRICCRAARTARRSSGSSARGCSATWASTSRAGGSTARRIRSRCMAGENDVRLTIRSSAEDPMRAIFATLHEGGHALYDQGVRAELHGTLLADAPSMGMHESQARLWENHVGRSAAFWRHYFARCRRRFPATSRGIDARGFHRAINVDRAGPESRRRRRSHVQPARARALRARDRAARRRPRRRRPSRRVGRALSTLPRCQRVSAARRLPAGRALGARRVRLLSRPTRSATSTRRSSSTRTSASTTSTPSSRSAISARCVRGSAEHTLRARRRVRGGGAD